MHTLTHTHTLHRPILAEIQCLVGSAVMAAPNMKISPRRASDGFPMQRLQLICAVIEKRLKLSLWNRDVYLNVVGGLRVSEPASDLAVAVTITSSLVGMKIKAGICFIGEIGLSGEIRRIKGLEIRIAEAVKMGFTTIIVPDLGPKNPFKKKKISNFSRVEKSDVKIQSGDSDVNIDHDNDISNNDDNNNTDHGNESDQNNVNEEYEYKKTKSKENKNSGHEVISCSTLVQALTIALEVENFSDILDKLKNSSRKKRKNPTTENQERSKWPSRAVEKEMNFYSENINEFNSNMNRNNDNDDDDYDDDIDENY
jgi:Subunit ChlI of Mg-chelatase